MLFLRFATKCLSVCMFVFGINSFKKLFDACALFLSCYLCTFLISLLVSANFFIITTCNFDEMTYPALIAIWSIFIIISVVENEVTYQCCWLSWQLHVVSTNHCYGAYFDIICLYPMSSQKSNALLIVDNAASVLQSLFIGLVLFALIDSESMALTVDTAISPHRAEIVYCICHVFPFNSIISYSIVTLHMYTYC